MEFSTILKGLLIEEGYDLREVGRALVEATVFKDKSSVILEEQLASTLRPTSEVIDQSLSSETSLCLYLLKLYINETTYIKQLTVQ